MFNIPIENIKIQDIEKFLQSGVKEGTLLDFKEQFPSRLEKTMSSMANTFGGMILIGVEETTTGGGVLPIKGVPLKSGLRETVNQIGINSIYPPLIPEVTVVEFKSDPALAAPDKAVVVIRVHESEDGHAVEQRTTVYVRTDNVSDPMRKATVEEVDWFLKKREKSHQLKERMIQQAQGHAQQYLVRARQRRGTPEPKGRFILWTVPAFPRLPLATSKELYKESQRLVRRKSGMLLGSFPVGLPRPSFEGTYWAQDELGRLFYTEIQQLGLIYSEFEFWWDGEGESVFAPQAAATILREAAQFGRDLYTHFGYLGLFDLKFRLTGIRDRYIQPTMFMKPQIMDDMIEMNARISAGATDDEVISQCKQIMRDVYWAFGWDVEDKRIDEDFK